MRLRDPTDVINLPDVRKLAGIQHNQEHHIPFPLERV